MQNIETETTCIIQKLYTGKYTVDNIIYMHICILYTCTCITYKSTRSPALYSISSTLRDKIKDVQVQ